jgi:hypothetical protein
MKRPVLLRGSTMKVKVIKKASNVKPTGFCGAFVDEPPMNKK